MNLKVISFQIADSIDIKLFKTTFPATIRHADSYELFYIIENNKYLYILKYGNFSLLPNSQPGSLLSVNY